MILCMRKGVVSALLLLLAGVLLVNQAQAQTQTPATLEQVQPAPATSVSAVRQAHEVEPVNPSDSDGQPYQPAHPIRLWLGVLHAGVSYDLHTYPLPSAILSLYAEGAVWIAPASLGLTARFPRQPSGGYVLTGIGFAPETDLFLMRLIGGWQSRGSLFYEVGILVTPPLLNLNESRRREVTPIVPLVRLGLRL